MVLALCRGSNAQSLVEFCVTDVHAIERRAALQQRVYVDWNITFSITNRSENEIVVFGMEFEDGRFDPVRYLLHFNKKTNSWDYPNSSNAPTPWEKESSVMKHKKILRPGESLTFSRDVSRVSDCGLRMVYTAQVGAPKSKKTHEIRSEEYVVPCSEQKPDASSKQIEHKSPIES
ncbi:MAG: hypothetical protein DYH05_08785 [Acidobacteria bacterium ACB1]|nr:hypothetical protein [Pyrinomonadaceae bacterium]MCE7962577.1 hypothetical protein [Acidobacteria bacterium ACB1]RIJ94217.1 MAG: hypothetical protein DCC44_05115 [Acidobacteriota bacterium]